MDNKGRNIFMACAGAYLAYTGYSLVVDVMSKEPANKTLFMIAGVIFVLIGAATIIVNLKSYFKDFKKDVFETEESVEETFEDVVDEVEDESVERHNHVEIINMSAEEEAKEEELEVSEESEEE